MKGIFVMKKLTLTILVLVLSFVMTCVVSAKGTVTEIKEHGLTLTLPDGFTSLDSTDASEKEEVVENFGYTVSSFKNYLEQNNILLFAADKNGTQLFLRCWETDFSKEINDLGVLEKDSLKTVASKIITIKGSEYKSLTVNGMRLLEVLKSDNDSGGDFFSVQYVTIRNGKIYSIDFAFPGSENEENLLKASETIKTLEISDKSTSSKWDVPSVLEMVFIWIIITAAAGTVIFIIFSFVKDYKKHNADNADTETIFRRKK